MSMFGKSEQKDAREASLSHSFTKQKGTFRPLG